MNLPARLRHDDDKDIGVQGFLRQIEEFGMADEAADIKSLTDKQRIALSLGTRMCAFTYSTAYSGIDTPGTSFCQLRQAISEFTGVEMTGAPQHIHAIAARDMLSINYVSFAP